MKVHSKFEMFSSDSIFFDDTNANYTSISTDRVHKLQTAFKSHTLNYERHKEDKKMFDRAILIIGTE